MSLVEGEGIGKSQGLEPRWRINEVTIALIPKLNVSYEEGCLSVKSATKTLRNTDRVSLGLELFLHHFLLLGTDGNSFLP